MGNRRRKRENKNRDKNKEIPRHEEEIITPEPECESLNELERLYGIRFFNPIDEIGKKLKEEATKQILNDGSPTRLDIIRYLEDMSMNPSRNERRG